MEMMAGFYLYFAREGVDTAGFQIIDRSPDSGANYAAIFLSIVPVVVIYIILSKFIIGGVAAGGVKE